MHSNLQFAQVAIAVLFVVWGGGEANAGDLVLEVSGLKQASGELRVGLFDSEDGFLEAESIAIGVRVKLSLVKGRDFAVTLHAVPPGKYAVSAYHDENGNGEQDTNLIGIPKEGYGFSNAAKGRMGPPSFCAAAFRVGSESVRVPIAITYR
jgi:uncharacterized protein (DUF2141 family)